MFAAGSGIGPFKSFWEARAYESINSRNILFFSVQSRKYFLYENEIRRYVKGGFLEAHIVFSRDPNGLIYSHKAQDLIERPNERSSIGSAIIEERAKLSDLVTSKTIGGSGAYFYICGPASLYETVLRSLRTALDQHRGACANELLATALKEGRFMLDVFTLPREMPISAPMITLSKLAQNAGHKNNERMWIGVHGCVYDVTDFLPNHPGGSAIVAASAGLDVTSAFDRLAHTTNGEIIGLLREFFIGYLSPAPQFLGAEILDLRARWVDHLRLCVETLTAFSLEDRPLTESTQLWFSDGRLNLCTVRKFYQLQSRLLQTQISQLFGEKYLNSLRVILIDVDFGLFL